jgi:glyoxylase-like metal-dependent hydrolase (beta-lactamase superfamily II)
VSGLDVRAFTVGPVQENAYIVRADSATERALLIDPGEEAPRLLEAVRDLGVTIEAILITHCHFDHIGAVAPVARATGAPVYCPRIEEPLLKDITAWTPPGFGPFESWNPEHTLAGGEHLSLAGLDIEVVFTPGHSPGHVTYAISPAARTRAHAGARAAGSSTEEPTPALDPPAAAAQAAVPALLSGDVLFQGSIGRTDLPGGDWNVLERSIVELVRRFPGEAVVYPGHMGVTTLGRELATNPFLLEVRRVAETPSAPDAAGAGWPAGGRAAQADPIGR